MRGLIEISSYCKNNCLYCGLRCDNKSAERYRLTPQQIFDCCRKGFDLGFRTFVLQGGEDPWFSDDNLLPIVSQLHASFPSCAITLSLGERSKESYQKLYEAGASRYLLRHETANAAHYAMLHPSSMSFDNRMQSLRHLMEIGYQVGCGFMVASPGQTIETLYDDLLFIASFRPQMVGIGPFIPAKDTPFADFYKQLHTSNTTHLVSCQQAAVDLTLRLLAIIRLLHPHVLLPATTALATLHPQGREMGLEAGANVIMPNLSPVEDRAKYSIYDNKLASGLEAAEGVIEQRRVLSSMGLQSHADRGDYK